MRRQWRIRIQGRDFRILRSRDASSEESAARIQAPALFRLLRDWLRTVEVSKRKAFLREILTETSRPSPPAERTDFDWFLARIEQKVLGGILIGVPIPRPAGYGVGKDEAEPAEMTPVAPAEEPEETTWIEIELVDTNGDPVPNEAFSLTLPDGVVRAGQLNSAGLARVTGIPAGTCRVTFPGIDGREWNPA